MPALVFIGVLFACMAAPAGGVAVNNLYNAVVEVPDTGEKARKEGFERALEQVLVRLTGRRDIPEMLEDESGDTVFDRATDLVDAYSYRRDDETLELHVSVSASALGRVLAEREIAVWGANRPGVLVWFMVDDRGDRQLVHRDASLPPFLEEPMRPLDDAGLEETGPWKGPLTEQAKLRGIPLYLPFNDDQDQERVNLSEIWGLFPEPIEAASERYGPDRIAIVRVNRLGDGWRARWTLRQPGEGTLVEGTERVDSRKELAESLMDRWAGHFTEVFSVSYGEDREPRNLHVIASDVGSLGDYAAIRRALLRMEPIRSVEPRALKREQLHLVVRFHGDLPLVRDYIGLDSRFRLMAGPPDGAIGSDQGVESLAVPGAGASDDEPNVLYYRWRSEDDDEEDLEAVDEGDEQRIVPLSDPSGNGEGDGDAPTPSL